MTSMLSLFESITCLSLIHLEEIKLIAIVNGFFDMSDFWRSFVISFKNGLISS